MAKHECNVRDEVTGLPLEPDKATCGTCHQSWCFRCDPTPASLCPWCCGVGYSTAPLVELSADERLSSPEKSGAVVTDVEGGTVTINGYRWMACRLPDGTIVAKVSGTDDEYAVVPRAVAATFRAY